MEYFADTYYKKQDFRNGICRNKLKEEIKAKTIQNVMGLKVVSPVRGVSKIKNDRNELKDDGRNFYQALEMAKAKREDRQYRTSNAPVNEVLERMGGMNQYDRHAREIFFALSSTADYKC